MPGRAVVGDVGQPSRCGSVPAKSIRPTLGVLIGQIVHRQKPVCLRNEFKRSGKDPAALCDQASRFVGRCMQVAEKLAIFNCRIVRHRPLGDALLRRNECKEETSGLGHELP